MYNVIVAGGRDFNDPKLHFKSILDSWFHGNFNHVVSGMARGADSMAVEYATKKGLVLDKFPADWDTHGNSAGYRRNEEMAKHSHVLLAFWDGESKGTKHMIDIALREGLEVHVYRY